LLEESKDLMNMLDMFLQYLAIDQHIVSVCGRESMVVWANGLADISLKCCRCMCESKGHNQGFKEAIVGTCGYLPDIFISYPNKAIGISNVNFRDVFGMRQLGQRFSN
jgi:hypothetical protein